MSSIASHQPDAAARAIASRDGFDAAMRGRRAECDGGKGIEGTHFAGRQEFAGVLTGHFRDFGDYPWRWYLMTDFTRKPTGFTHEAVWCDAGNLIIEGEE